MGAFAVQEGPDQNADQGLGVGHLVGRHPVEHRLAFGLHRDEPPGHHRVDEVLSAAEVVVDRGVVALAGSLGDVAQRHLEAMLGDQALSRVEQLFPGSGAAVHTRSLGER